MNQPDILDMACEVVFDYTAECVGSLTTTLGILGQVFARDVAAGKYYRDLEIAEFFEFEVNPLIAERNSYLDF